MSNKSGSQDDKTNTNLQNSSRVNERAEDFGKNIFNENAMRKYLEAKYVNNYLHFMEGKAKLTRETIEKLAEGMLKWSLENNATHFIHWFQPVTNSIAEKRNTFLQFNHLKNEAIKKFSWKNLLKHESDVSCFPHDSVEANYHTSGYTAWDPSSFVFIFNRVLCIPAVFISHNEQSLDNKIPLLKAESKLKKHMTKFVKLFNCEIIDVHTVLGWQQEFYLLKKKLVEKRLDLSQLGRTLIGSSFSNKKRMEDYSFGSINKNVINYLDEVQNECIILGIPIRSIYNEEAPNQFEISHSHESLQIATDHNSLLINIMEKVAYEQNFKVILHENPFKGLKSSSKFCNFSFISNDGLNLLECGERLEDKVRFLAFISVFLKAVCDNEDLIKASVVSYENEHRLGGISKQPSVISVFLEDKVNKMIEDLLKNDSFEYLKIQESEKTFHSIIENLPQTLRSDLNGNKMSPIALLGNKFEFRSTGSEQNCAKPMTTIISILANQLKLFLTELDLTIKKENLSIREAIYKITKDYILYSKKVIFTNKNVSQDQITEASKRKIDFSNSTLEKFKALKSDKSISLFTSLNVFSKEEILLRYEIELQTYVMKIKAEANILYELIMTFIVPDSIKYQNLILDNYSKIKNNGFDIEYTVYQPEIIKSSTFI